MCPIFDTGKKNKSKKSKSNDQKAYLLTARGSQVKEFAAHDLLQSLLGLIQGKGGGKADLAQASGSHLEGLKYRRCAYLHLIDFLFLIFLLPQEVAAATIRKSLSTLYYFCYY